MVKAPRHADADVGWLVEQALAEDGRDLTSELIFPDPQPAKAELVAQAQGVLCGTSLIEAVLLKVDDRTRIELHLKDGAALTKGSRIATFRADIKSLLRAERPLLNFVQHLSGIATLAAAFVAKVKASKMKILDTRKTLPGWRRLQKYAVSVGGGLNHRFNLEEMILIKDNHIAAAGGIEAALAQVRQHDKKVPVVVEASSLADVQTLLKGRVDRIMLDNFTLANVKEAVRYVGGVIPLEVSGGLRLDNISEFAGTGVDFASIGMLTHSANALDINLTIVKG